MPRTPTRSATSARALAAAEILLPESPLGFVHPLVRDAVYLDLAPAERELQHERAARMLVELEAAPELIATHLLMVPCRSDRWVATLLHDAGLAAMRRGDAESAVSPEASSISPDSMRRGSSLRRPVPRRTAVVRCWRWPASMSAKGRRGSPAGSWPRPKRRCDWQTGSPTPWRSAPAEVSYGAAYMAQLLIERASSQALGSCWAGSPRWRPDLTSTHWPDAPTPSC